LGSLLKALGLTIWGLVAFGLLVVFIFVGYQAALRFHSPGVSIADTHSTKDQSDSAPALRPPTGDTVKQTSPDHKNSVSASKQISSDVTRMLLRGAAERHQYETAVEYGRELYDGGNADPGDLLIIAHAFFAIKDCANALTWLDRAIEAFHAAAKEPDASVHQIRTGCESGSQQQHIKIGAEQMERVTRLLNSFGERAEADRRNLPQLEGEAARSKSGDLDIRLGELYYGFGDYQHAIAAIERGLEKGQITHLDDAYVYLGLSQQAVKNVAEARKAFDKLKEVPNISPRILRLLELYAETRL
jgi:tetratricopeptide (TPR) repeat protein